MLQAPSMFEFLCDCHSLTLFSLFLSLLGTLLLRFVFACVFPCLTRWIQFCQLLEHGIRGRYFGRRLCTRTKDENEVATTRTMKTCISSIENTRSACQFSALEQDIRSRITSRVCGSLKQDANTTATVHVNKKARSFLIIVKDSDGQTLAIPTRKVDMAMDGYTLQ